MLVSLATLQDPRSAESPSETIGSKNRLLHPSRAARPNRGVSLRILVYCILLACLIQIIIKHIGFSVWFGLTRFGSEQFRFGWFGLGKY